MTTLTAPDQGYTNFHTVTDSSVIDEIVYDSFDRKLFVFLASGSVAAYKDVDIDDFESFVAADSVGRYWNQVIKKKFRGINSDVRLYMRNTSLPTSVEAEVESPVNDEPTTTQANRRWLVTIEVEAPNLGTAVNDVVSQGFEVVAVNPQ